jgi:predicted nucleic acid-binding protein
VIIISDSSPLIVLVKIGRVELLHALFGRVLVPPEVRDELGYPKRPDAVRAFVASPPAWLEVRAPAKVDPIPGLQAGEAAAISLAQELKADRIIIDESKGRKEATARNLRVVGTLGVLEIAAEEKLTDLAQAFEDLKKTDFWVSQKLLDNRLALFRERERRQQQETAERERGRAPDARTAPEKDSGHEPER